VNSLRRRKMRVHSNAMSGAKGGMVGFRTLPGPSLVKEVLRLGEETYAKTDF